MQSKTTRAFRTISEAGEELELQPHVLRFWESKFPQIKQMKRGGGRRFYRPEDIEFLRGIKILLHDEKHPIKDVQKLIRVKGAARVLELGRSVERAAKPKAIEDTVLVPERIVKADDAAPKAAPKPVAPPPAAPVVETMPTPAANNDTILRPIGTARPAAPPPIKTPPPTAQPQPPVLDLVEPLVEDREPEYHEGMLDDVPTPPQSTGLSQEDRDELETALERLLKLRGRWDSFEKAIPQKD